MTILVIEILPLYIYPTIPPILPFESILPSTVTFVSTAYVVNTPNKCEQLPVIF